MIERDSAEVRVRVEDLIRWIELVLECVGLDEKARRPLAMQMVNADLLGHKTHGVALLGMYLERFSTGEMRATSRLELVSHRPAVRCWDAEGSVGAWAMEEVRGELCQGVREFGQMSATLARVSHIGNLQSHLLPYVEDEGLVVLLTTTTPAVRSVAPPGAGTAVITTNPIAFGAPAGGKPILVDTTTSIASNSFFKSLIDEGKSAPIGWLRDATGASTEDPKVLSEVSPSGTIASLGAPEAPHKGFGLGLMSEIFALGLSGWGRARDSRTRLSSVFLTLFDPEAFGGKDRFLREMQFLVRSIELSGSGGSNAPPRLPGSRAIDSRDSQLRHGVKYDPRILGKCKRIADDLNVSMFDIL